MKMSLRQRIKLVHESAVWLNVMATAHHYLHRPVHHRAVPFGWSVVFDGEKFQANKKPNGFIIFIVICALFGCPKNRHAASMVSIIIKKAAHNQASRFPRGGRCNE